MAINLCRHFFFGGGRGGVFLILLRYSVHFEVFPGLFLIFYLVFRVFYKVFLVSYTVFRVIYKVFRVFRKGCSGVFQVFWKLFRDIPGILKGVPGCSEVSCTVPGVPGCSVVFRGIPLCSVFRCSWNYYMPKSFNLSFY